MFAKRIACWTEFPISSAANFLTLVLTTRLEFIAKFWAEIRYRIHLFLCHNKLSFWIWVIHWKTRIFRCCLATKAFFRHSFITFGTLALMTSQFALMFTTVQESATKIITKRDWIFARFARVPKKFFNLYVSRWTIDYSFWVSWAWFALSLMANLFTLMLTAI